MKTARQLAYYKDMEAKGFAVGYLNIRTDSIGFCYGDKAWEFSTMQASEVLIPNKWCWYAKIDKVKRVAKKLGIEPIKRMKDT